MASAGHPRRPVCCRIIPGRPLVCVGGKSCSCHGRVENKFCDRSHLAAGRGCSHGHTDTLNAAPSAGIAASSRLDVGAYRVALACSSRYMANAAAQADPTAGWVPKRRVSRVAFPPTNSAMTRALPSTDSLTHSATNRLQFRCMIDVGMSSLLGLDPTSHLVHDLIHNGPLTTRNARPPISTRWDHSLYGANG